MTGPGLALGLKAQPPSNAQLLTREISGQHRHGLCDRGLRFGEGVGR